ncbi:phosphatidylserine decarboxylase [Helicobacter cetorum]|uniref:phosphatidylserine decarboxylase n=1 Tax=Helicobacter cetorum TaxID=138563 RepID=UPI000CF0775C|nr:phosphatidylserine decarboxylase [Helicobacter cetorum]
MVALSNALSRVFGSFANYEFPPFIQKQINALYVKIFKIDLSEFEPLENYKSLNALFTRSLKKERFFDASSNTLISPCDSLITECKVLEDNQALQIKGMFYYANELVGEDKPLDNSYFYMNFYLSPKDYHHYHAPCDLEILEARYFPGKLLPVNMPSLYKNKNLFVGNERVVLVARDVKGNKLYFVAVGALNVGKMRFLFDERIQTNAKNMGITKKNQKYSYNSPILIKKAQLLGNFEMGSTIVIFAQNIAFKELREKCVKFGESIGEFNAD